MMLPGRVGIKKNGKSAFISKGRAFITTSQNYKKWARDASLHILQQKNRTQTQLPIKGPITLTCRFYFPNHQWEADLSNLYQGIEDILQELGIIEDDKLIYSHDGSRKIFGAQDFYTEIEIREHVLDNLPLMNLALNK